MSTAGIVRRALVSVFASLLLLLGAVLAAAQGDVGIDASSDRFRAMATEAEAAFLAGRYSDADDRYHVLIAGLTDAYGQDSVPVAQASSRLAFMYYHQGRLTEAETLASNALGKLVQLLPSLDIRLADALDTLATIQLALGRVDQAETHQRRAITIAEAVGDQRFLSSALSSLAQSYRKRQRFDDAFQLEKRSLDILQRLFPDDLDSLQTGYNNLAQTAQDLGRGDEAVRYSEKALEMAAASLPAEHPGMAFALANHAGILNDVGRFEESEPLMRRATRLAEHALPEGHPEIARLYNGMVYVLDSLDRTGEALGYAAAALEQQERSQLKGSPAIATTISNLAWLSAKAGRYEDALGYWDRFAEIAKASERRTGVAAHSWRASAAQRLDIAERLIERDGRKSFDLIVSTRRKAFEDFQRDRISAAGVALAAATARMSSGNPEATRLIRQRDQLLETVERLKQAFGSLVNDTTMDGQARLLEMAAIQAEIETAGFRIESLDVALDRLFPEYANLSAERPLSVEEVQQLLEPDEVLVSINPIGNDGYVFAYSSDGGYLSEFYHFDDDDMRVGDLARYVRCTAAFAIDAACRDNPMGEYRQLPAAGTGTAAAETRGAAPIDDRPHSVDFDIVAAHYLYFRLFPPDLRPMIEGKKLIIAPAPELLGIPWHLLVTELPAHGWNEPGVDLLALYQATPWLFRQHPSITVVPTIASLKALRGDASLGRPVRSYLGIADPVIGTSHSERTAAPTGCSPTDPHSLAGGGASQPVARAAAAPATALFTQVTDRLHRPRADVDQLRRQPRLPDTRCEVSSVAQALHERGARAVNLFGPKATESAIKQLSRSGELARYDILHFATHGIVGGQVDAGKSGLVLTPPERGTDEDDGILTVDEIAALSMAARWVILSACNTAAGDEVNGEALTGLARSFFYAGARSLLVSSWPVYSRAAAELTTRTFAALSAHPGIDRGEALNIAMEETLQEAQSHFEAHPGYWAPFFMVGEGR